MQTRHTSKTRFLDAALRLIRAKGYASTTVDDLCTEAELTKGSFFHHFPSKEALGVAAAAHFAQMAEGLFATGAYRDVDDPLDRLLGYVDFRDSLIQGDIPDFTCLLGTIVQESYQTHPALREACDRHTCGHTATVAEDVAEAKRLYAPDAPWTPESLALFTQAALQGAFVLANAGNDASVARECVGHLRRYLESRFTR